MEPSLVKRMRFLFISEEPVLDNTRTLLVKCHSKAKMPLKACLKWHAHY